MIQEKILSIIYSAINVWGTIWAIRSILTLTEKDLANSRTIGAMCNPDKGLITQKEESYYGISMIIVSSIGQTVLSLVPATLWTSFAIYMVITLLVVGITLLCMKNYNTKFKKSYELKEKNDDKSRKA